MTVYTKLFTPSTIGLYWFASFELYRKTYDTYYADAKNMERGEKYIAPMYNQMIQDGEDVYLHEVAYDMVTPLGIPAEVDSFIQQQAPDIRNETSRCPPRENA